MNDSVGDDPAAPPDGHRAMVEHFPNGVLVLFDDALRYRIVGPTTLPFSGREAADMVDEPFDDLFPDETVAFLEPHLEATIAGERRAVDTEYDGRVHHVETRPIELDGHSFGLLATQDVTDDRAAERELERENERLDEFATLLTHDLQDPLSAALARLAVYRQTENETDLDELQASLERMEERTIDLLALARKNAESVDRRPVSLAAVAEAAWANVDSRAAALKTTPGRVRADESKLQTLLEHCFRNAVEHGSTNSRTASDDAGEQGDAGQHGDVGELGDASEHGDAAVTVSVGFLENGFFVADSGRGIEAGDSARIFEHGYSAGGSSDGVGLTIVTRIATAHGWDCSIATSERDGARFEFRQAE